MASAPACLRVTRQSRVWRDGEARLAGRETCFAALADTRPTVAAEAFYGRCPPEIVKEAHSHVCPEPAAPLSTPLDLGAGFSSVPKIYIGALEDRAVPPALQRRVAEHAGVAFQTIDADHSPFFSAVNELAAHLHEAGAHLLNPPN